MKAKAKLCSALFVVLALNAATALARGNAGNSNLQATRIHYAQLISGSTPRMAELALFANMLPKGGDLHHHYSGAVYAETYLDWAGAQGYCVYTMAFPNADPNLDIKKFQIRTKPLELNDKPSENCISVDAVRANANAAFYRDLLQTWSDKDFYNHTHEQIAPDQHFFDTFGYFGVVSGYDFHNGLQMLKARAKAENLGYLETMLKGGPSVEDINALNKVLNGLSTTGAAPPSAPSSLPPAATPPTPKQIDEALRQAYELLAHDPHDLKLPNAEVEQKIAAFVSQLEAAAAGLDDDSFKLRFQTYVSRNSTPAKVFTALYTSFEAAARSKLVVGVNIVGPENGPVAMHDYSLHMQMFAFLKGRYPQVRLAMHAGELVLGMVPPEGLRSHIREAVLVAGASRIGHGVDIAHETDAPALLNEMKQRKVAVEVNLTSNAFILGVQPEAHPLPLYARYGVPFVISTDDAGVSRNNLSGEYLIYMSRFKPSYAQLKQVVYNSITYSFLSEADKQEELRRLNQRFAAFEAQVARLPRLRQ